MKLLRKYPETTLITLAIVFLAIIIASFSWGIGQVVTQVNRGVNSEIGNAGSVSFDIATAKQLDLRGLMPR